MTDYVVAQSFLSFFVKGAPRERPDLVSGQFRVHSHDAGFFLNLDWADCK